MGILERFRLDGKVALLSGGAGLYGRQILRGLAEANAKVFAASRNLDALTRETETLRQEGLDVSALHLDQASEASIRQLRDQIIATAGRVDILVNNAVLRTMSDWDSPSADFAASMEVNATGLFMMTREFGSLMANNGGGSIINIGSIQGMVGPDFTLYEGLDWGSPPDYFFHKGGLLQLTRFAAAKLGSRGVRVNAISPGGFYTGQDPRFVERYNSRTFLGRMANDTDLAGTVVFLASEASAYITGGNIPVDGGYTAK
jgi:NAD(P)-dependent dehydrogenase (short-subunit alcohol dehydrogenase family)